MKTKLKENDEIKLSLLQGWLDILLTKKSPKPEDYHTKPIEQAFCKLNNEGTVFLMNNVSAFLVEHINYGGGDGAQLASEMKVLKLRLAEDLMNLLIYSTNSSNAISLGEVFQSITVSSS